jgi:hypothetical protein
MQDSPSLISKNAVMSSCSTYRYLLWREWDAKRPPYVSGMLNPSTADAEQDDPTITRNIRRARALGFGSLIVWNLYAFRATDPSALLSAIDPVGPDNLKWIEQAIRECRSRGGAAVVGWGSHGTDRSVIASVQAVALATGVELQCLGTTKEGHPRHPLYVSYATPLQPWTSENAMAAVSARAP